jgi:hypothetical protein
MRRRTANLALLHDEVRILIFDDPAELERGQRPVMVKSGRGFLVLSRVRVCLAAAVCDREPRIPPHARIV